MSKFKDMLNAWLHLNFDRMNKIQEVKVPHVHKSKLKLRKYFISGINQSSLWRGLYSEGDKRMVMEHWVRNPFTHRMDWMSSIQNEWQEDKDFGVREVNAFYAESKFPGSIKGSRHGN